jgi:uncharacterized OsmC-like protein
VAHGDVETDDGVLVLRRIHVVFTLRAVTSDAWESARRAHETFKMKCPVYRSIHRAIDVTTELTLEGDASGGASS